LDENPVVPVVEGARTLAATLAVGGQGKRPREF
jgi:hypothetical protein